MLLRAAAVSFAILAASPLAIAQPSTRASAEPAQEVRIYDVSDLPTDTNFGAFAGFMPVRFEQVTSSLIAVAATAEDHDRFRAVLGQLREIAPARVGVSLALRAAPGNAKLAVGQPLPDAMSDAPVVRRIQVAGVRRTQFSANSMDSITYVKDLTPIVGNSSAAIDPTMDLARNGLGVDMVVGDSSNGRSPISIRGRIVSASVAGRTRVAAAAPGEFVVGPDAIDLLTTTERTLFADLVVPEGRPIVAAVADDPANPGASLVLTVELSPAQ